MPRVGIKVTRPQSQFINTDSPFPAIVAGYGAGKSQAAVLRTTKLALQYPGMPQGFVEPTFDLVRLIAWPRFDAVLNQMGVDHELNKSESIMYLSNGSNIIFRSADNPERMVGFEVADATIDELDTLKTEHAAEVWQKMLGRCRAKKPDGKPNTLAAASTPEGFRFMYQTWGKNPQPGYELIRAPTSSNPYLPDGYIDQLKATYTGPQLEAYLDGQFVNLTSGSVYAEFDRALNASNETIQGNEPIHVGMDFNVGNVSASVAVLRGDTVHFVAEWTGIRDTPSMAAMLKERYAGHHISIYPDASGAATKSTNAALSDLVILRAAGFTVLANGRNPAIRDRVASVNAMIHNQGQRRLFVKPDTCPTLVEGLERQAYDKNGDPDKSSGFDHLNDATGYLVTYKFPVHRGSVRLASITGL